MFISDNPEQLQKARPSMLVTVSGMSIFSIKEQLENAPYGILVARVTVTSFNVVGIALPDV